MTSRQTTQGERDATRKSGQVDPKGFDKETPEQQDADTLSIEELATMYVSLGGNDPRAVAVIEAGKKAGHINKDGEYIGPDPEMRRPQEASTKGGATDSCGANSCGGKS